MNIEEQCLDLCNVKTKKVDDDHNTTNNTEEVISRISELVPDGDADKQSVVPIEASEMYLMPQLTDNHQAVDEDNHQQQDTLEIDEVNGNSPSSAQDTAAVENPTHCVFSNDEQHKDTAVVEKMKEDADTDPTHFVVGEGDDGGDMDMGVDLTLDESGVLETDPTSSLHNSLEFVPKSEAVPDDESQIDSQESSATDHAVLYPSVDEGDDKHKPGGKRVTFPSDEDIVSGAVEPKNPWRHGNIMCLCLRVNS